MSVDAGGLAQMTYNSSFNGGGLGVPGSGFASRGKGNHIKRLSVPHPQKIDENQNSSTVSTPRTSRSHLLAGLRTAPKTGTPSTAPLSQRSARHNVEQSKYGPSNGAPNYGGRAPQTATGAGFPNQMYGGGNSNMSMGRQMYSLPEHVLAPPSIDLAIDEGEEPMDEKLYAELVSTNLFLAEQQQRLQQQLASVTAAAQQFQGLNLNQSAAGMQQQYQSPGFPNAGYYQQQLLQGMQPVVQPVPGQPGVFSVYNPMTGQQNFVRDNSVQQEEIPPPMYQDYLPQQSPATVQTPVFRAEVSPPPELSESPVQSQRSNSPAKTAPSPPQEVNPLPPPSANAFRRSHKKTPSGIPGIKTSGDGLRGNGPKSAGFPATPQTGTFGPGQGRAGEHPIRQPRGPPSLEELVAKPTSKHEGSKNFATRQRRRAVHNLVRAGIERRGESRSSGNNSSGGSGTPASETEFTFSASDNDDPATRSGSLSSKPSLGSLRAAASGAIGSERKEKDRGSVDGHYSPNGDEGVLAGKLNEVRLDDAATAGVSGHRSNGSLVGGQGSERRPMSMRFLSGSEKRKSPIM